MAVEMSDKLELKFNTCMHLANLHFEWIFRLLLERVRDELHGGEGKLFHVFDVGDGALKSTACHSIARIHRCPAFEVDRVAVCTASAGAYERNAMVSYVHHVNEGISIENINTRRLHVDFRPLDIPHDDTSILGEHAAESRVGRLSERNEKIPELQHKKLKKKRS